MANSTWSLSGKSNSGFLPNDLIGLLFSLPPPNKSSSGMFGNSAKKLKIFSSSSLSSLSLSTLAAVISLTLAKILETSSPFFFAYGTLADNLFISALLPSTN